MYITFYGDEPASKTGFNVDSPRTDNRELKAQLKIDLFQFYDKERNLLD
jgi:hypothetical protein